MSGLTEGTQWSAAQTRCLIMHEQRDTVELEIRRQKKYNLVDEHQKRMKVGEAELQYWISIKKTHD